MALRKTDIDRLEIRSKRYLVHDGNGLYLEVMPTGKKVWRLRFQHNGKTRNVTVGEYPKLGVREARFAAVRKRDEVMNGRTGTGCTFGYYADKWLKRHITPTVLNLG